MRTWLGSAPRPLRNPWRGCGVRSQSLGGKEPPDKSKKTCSPIHVHPKQRNQRSPNVAVFVSDSRYTLGFVCGSMVMDLGEVNSARSMFTMERYLTTYVYCRMLVLVNSFKFYVCYTTIGGVDSSKRENVSDNIANSFRRTFSQYKSETLCTNSSPRIRDSFYEYRI